MSKSPWYCLLALTLFGCAAGKLKPEESFLSPDSASDKVYIISAFPKKADSTGLFLSALLVKNNDGSNRQLATFVTTYDRSSRQLQTIPFFTDSLLPLDATRFPLLLKPVSTDSAKPSVTFSLDRNSMELAVDSPDEQSMEYVLEFPQQKPFKTSMRDTKFKLSAISPVSGTLTKWNNSAVNQSSDLFIHTLDNSEDLFGSRPAGNYCWLDCNINGSGYSLFFRYDSLGKITPVYSTFPEGAPHSIEPDSLFASRKQPESYEPVIFTMNFVTENGFDNVTIRLAPFEQKQVLTKNMFSVRAIDVLIDDRLTGTGILYIL